MVSLYRFSNVSSICFTIGLSDEKWDDSTMFSLSIMPNELVVNQTQDVELRILCNENEMCTDFRLSLKVPLQLSLLTGKRFRVGKFTPGQLHTEIVRLQAIQLGEYYLTCSTWSYRNGLGQIVKPDPFELKVNVISPPNENVHSAIYTSHNNKPSTRDSNKAANEPELEQTSLIQEEFHKALQSAFPDWPALEQMVAFRLEENLSLIASNHNLNAAMFYLVKWATAVGRFKQLVRGAWTQNPSNPALIDFVSKYYPDLME